MDQIWQEKPSAKVARKAIEWLTGPVAAILVLFFTSKDFSSIDVKELMWALIAYIFGEHFVRILSGVFLEDSRSKELEDIAKQIQGASNFVLSTFHSSLKVSHVRESDFIDRMRTSCRAAYHVKNTYIGIKEITGTQTDRGRAVLEHYKSVLSKGESASWEDIVGVAELLDGRFSNLSTSCRGLSGSHNIYVLSTHAPVLNFILLAGEDAHFNEVYFGWIQRPSSDFDMFYSTDHRVIRMFEAYFESMRSREDRVNHLITNYKSVSQDDNMLQSVPYRLKGRWLSVAGPANSLSKDDRSATPPVYQLWKYSIVTIDYTDEWKISGIIYFLGGRQAGVFSSEMCVMAGNSLYYKFSNKDEFSALQSEGIGALTLSSGAFRLRGYYTSGKHERSSVLRAVKLANSDFDDDGKVKQAALERALAISIDL